jgi:hypothetical protein
VLDTEVLEAISMTISGSLDVEKYGSVNKAFHGTCHFFLQRALEDGECKFLRNLGRLPPEYAVRILLE